MKTKFGGSTAGTTGEVIQLGGKILDFFFLCVEKRKLSALDRACLHTYICEIKKIQIFSSQKHSGQFLEIALTKCL